MSKMRVETRTNQDGSQFVLTISAPGGQLSLSGIFVAVSLWLQREMFPGLATGVEFTREKKDESRG